MEQLNVYRGFVGPLPKEVRYITFNGKPINPRLDLFNHSPDGFWWGSRGSGTSQSGLAIIAHYMLEVERPDNLSTEDIEYLAVHLHHKFADTYLVYLGTGEEWTITVEQIHAWLFLNSGVAFDEELKV